MRSRRAFLTLSLAGWLVAVAGAQSPSGQMAGRVSDKEGAAFPRVAVTLEGPNWSEFHTVISDEGGEYRVLDLAPGRYDVEFRRLGYCPVTVEGVSVQAGATTRTNGTLVEVPTHGRCPGETGEFIVRFETSLGNIDIGLDLQRAPITSLNFLKYVDGHFYDGGQIKLTAQVGGAAPTSADRPVIDAVLGSINPDRRSASFPPIPLERTSVTGFQHIMGTVSMARTTADSATSDFIILVQDQRSLDFGGATFADGQGAAAFGGVLAGLDVVRGIQQQSAPVTILSAHRVR